MKNKFSDFLKGSKNSAAALSAKDMKDELVKREVVETFPLDVFNDRIKPLVTALVDSYDAPRSYVGLALLSAYSSAIGTAYAVTPNGQKKFYMQTWGCFVGISSSGKTNAIDNIFYPIKTIQDELDDEYDNTPPEERSKQRMKQIWIRDAHVATVVRTVLPDNPKGMIKVHDEILEWINNMNILSRGQGSDEQFWISLWDATEYSAIRSQREKFVIKRPFINLLGGIQPELLYKLYAKDRDISGFIFRLLFAMPEEDKVILPDAAYRIPDEFLDIHTKCIRRLFEDLPVANGREEPKLCVLSTEAVQMHREWRDKLAHRINKIENLHDRNIEAGIMGKISNYAFRFAGILHLADRAFAIDSTNLHDGFHRVENVNEKTMERAIILADYFYKAAVKATDMVSKNIAPPEVLIAAALIKQGKSYSQMAAILFNDKTKRMKAHRQVSTWIKEYPKVFNARVRD